MPPDGAYGYVRNFIDSDISILKINGPQVTDIGKKIKLPGHPASLRGRRSDRTGSLRATGGLRGHSAASMSPGFAHETSLLVLRDSDFGTEAQKHFDIARLWVHLSALIFLIRS